MEVALGSRLMYKQSQETRKHQDGLCKHGTAALQSPPAPALCPPQGTHSSPFMPVLMGSGRIFIFYSQGIYTSYVYPRQVVVRSPWGVDVAVLWWKTGRCWEIKEWP